MKKRSKKLFLGHRRGAWVYLAALGVSVVLGTPCRGEDQLTRAKPAAHKNLKTVPHRAAMRIDAWFSLDASEKKPWLGALNTGTAPDKAEEIVVYGQRNRHDADWRTELFARQPTYEASNSGAAQPLVPYATYTSPDQQRMMSEKTNALGLCGAFWGYVQCPNPPP